MEWPRSIVTRRLTGQEVFTRGGRPGELAVLDFWQWACSELAGNTLRGVLAEFLVARALDACSGYRMEWAAADITTAAGMLVEVKSASYFQVWAQRKPSPIRFSIAPTHGWEAQTGAYEATARRQAHLYVFAILGRPGLETVDPLNLDDWEFLVLPSRLLTERVGGQKSIGLGPLLQLEPERVGHDGLAACLRRLENEIVRGGGVTGGD